MTKAAFRGSYADWRLIKTRGVVQVVFEVPLHEADIAYQVLGGMPDHAKEKWCGIALLADKTVKHHDHLDVTISSRDGEYDAATSIKPRQVAPDKMLAQQAGIVCKDPKFWEYLGSADEESAAAAVRTACDVTSRSEIKLETEAGARWQELYQFFLIWRTNDEAA